MKSMMAPPPSARGVDVVPTLALPWPLQREVVVACVAVATLAPLFPQPSEIDTRQIRGNVVGLTRLQRETQFFGANYLDFV